MIRRIMKTAKILLWIGLFAMVIGSIAQAGTTQGFDLGARYHQEQSKFAALPYGDGDLGYGLGYEVQDENGAFQLICGYTPDFKNRDDLDYALTPEANLLVKDGVYQGGLGVLKTYSKGGDAAGEWTDLYWQFILGINIPLSKRVSLQANAYYVFEGWDSLNNFRVNDLEYAAYLGFSF